LLVFALSLLALLATLAGGWLVLRFHHLPAELLAFSAGTLFAIVVLDLIPHTLKDCGLLSFGGILLGYGAMHLWQRLGGDDHHHDNWHPEMESGKETSLIGAGALLLHKLFDGALLGVGLSSNLTLGLGVAAAVILHSFCDGINTVTLVLRAGRSRKLAALFLGANAVAPLIAAIAVGSLNFSHITLDWMLTFVTGTFVYLIIHDLVPAALAEKNSLKLSMGGSLCSGILLTWGIIGLFGG
jgi:zinc transporter ZupT